MNSFKTLDELDEFNNRGFEQVFGAVENNSPENLFDENSWEALKFYSRPHDVFKLDWSNYGSMDFANTFLPYIKKTYSAKGSYMFDGAELFKDSRRAKRELLPLTNSDKLITVIGYSYPKGVLVAQRKNRISVAKHEVLVFFEVDEFGTVDVSFKFGSNFKNFLKTIDLKSEKENNKTEPSEV